MRSPLTLTLAIMDTESHGFRPIVVETGRNAIDTMKLIDGRFRVRCGYACGTLDGIKSHC